MPRMNLKDYDTFAHLIQLFLAANPQWQPITAALRQETDLAHDYFLSESMTQALVRWARDRHLITRRAGHELLRTMALLGQTDAATAVPVTRRYLGTPPRWQPTVREADICRFLYCQDPDPARTERAWTLPAAIRLAQGLMQDQGAPDPPADRAQALLAWLRGELEEGAQE